ncbi:MAG: superoxide dismutase [Desulfobacterales bacterium]|nr:superoxide dismutase [Desulfobacterales bacterium]
MATSGLAIAAVAVCSGLSCTSQTVKTISLPPLPFPENGLEPLISAKTIAFHYHKHHKGYFENLNKLINGTEFYGMPLEKVILKTYGNDDKFQIFNNASQMWNHTFYWQSLSYNKMTEPSTQLKQKINKSFDSLEGFKKQLFDISTTLFGSGWVWLVSYRNKLEIVKTANADSPMIQGMKPLMTIDLWEHAYYLDYQNRRSDYIHTVIEKLINWEFASKNDENESYGH